MSDYSKKIKRLLREWADKAYECELETELAKLEHSFLEWRNGKISPFVLSDRVHRCDTDILRKLNKKYNSGMNDFNIAYAIATDILDRKEIPTELSLALDKHLSFYQMMKDAGDLDPAKAEN